MKKIWHDMANNWSAYVLLIISFAFASILLICPDMFHRIPPNVADDFPSQLFEPISHGFMLIIFATVKFYGRITKRPKLQLFGLTCLNIVWGIVAVSLFWRFMHGVQSATFLLAVAMVLTGLGQAVKGDYFKRE